MGLKFPGFITYYDGIGFLVNNKLGVKSAKELDVNICIQPVPPPS
jgi:general L-amino acid transport system substrate-binding protein